MAFEQKTAVEMMLQQIESHLPIHQLHLDHDENHIDRSEESVDKLNDLYEQATMAIEWALIKGTPLPEAVKMVLSCEQFKDNDDLKKKINKRYSL